MYEPNLNSCFQTEFSELSTIRIYISMYRKQVGMGMNRVILTNAFFFV